MGTLRRLFRWRLITVIIINNISDRLKWFFFYIVFQPPSSLLDQERKKLFTALLHTVYFFQLLARRLKIKSLINNKVF